MLRGCRHPHAAAGLRRFRALCRSGPIRHLRRFQRVSLVDAWRQPDACCPPKLDLFAARPYGEPGTPPPKNMRTVGIVVYPPSQPQTLQNSYLISSSSTKQQNCAMFLPLKRDFDSPRTCEEWKPLMLRLKT